MNFLKYIFDFDGTLVDSMPTWATKVIRILENECIPYPDDIIKIVTPLGDMGTARYLRDVLGVRENVEDIVRDMNNFALPKYQKDITLKKGVAEYLASLRAGGSSLCVLTASPHELLDPCLMNNGIYDMFDYVWSCDDFGKTKSDPTIYADAAAVLGVKTGEIAFFDDNINALRAASRCGLYTVGVYDDTAADFRDEMARLADAYVNSFTELL